MFVLSRHRLSCTYTPVHTLTPSAAKVGYNKYIQVCGINILTNANLLCVHFCYQVMSEKGSSEVLNKLYDTAMEKLEAVKKEYDSLSKRYSEKVANHNTDLSRLEQAEEENRRLQKQMDALLKQRDSAMHYQQQYSTSMRR